jgi:two-component system, sensor histidine kinase SagS
MGVKVLVVDDDISIADLLTLDLKEAGFDVITEYSGYAALQRVMQNEADVVVSDIAMPDMDGCELLTRAREIRPEMPMILMTGFGYDPNHVLLRSAKVGMNGVMYKPFESDELIRRLRALPPPTRRSEED